MTFRVGGRRKRFLHPDQRATRHPEHLWPLWPPLGYRKMALAAGVDLLKTQELRAISLQSAAFQDEGPASALSLRAHEMQVLRLDAG